MQKLVRYLAILSLIVIVGYGFLIVGSPMENRRINQDYETIEELTRVHCALQRHYIKHGSLPKTLDGEALSKLPEIPYDCQLPCYTSAMFSKDLDRLYTYTPTTNGYQICAQFESDGATLRKHKSTHAYNNNDWDWATNVKQGDACFERRVEPCKKEKKHD